jgi:hypothetical protein
VLHPSRIKDHQDEDNTMIFWLCTIAICIAGTGLALILVGFDRSLDDYEHQSRKEIDMTFDPEDA